MSSDLRATPERHARLTCAPYMWRRAFRAVVLSVTGLLPVLSAHAQSTGGELIADPWQRSGNPSGALPGSTLTPWSPQRTKTLEEEIVDPWRRPASPPGPARTKPAVGQLEARSPEPKASGSESPAAVREVADPWEVQRRGGGPPSARFADIVIVDPWSKQSRKVPTAAFPTVVEQRPAPRFR